MKKILLAALAVPFVIAIPVVAHADPGGPPAIFTPQQECDTVSKMVNLVHKQRPDAKTPEQIVDAYDQILAQHGIDPRKSYPRPEDRVGFVQFTRDNMKRCNIH